jgi:hypothetical protein
LPALLMLAVLSLSVLGVLLLLLLLLLHIRTAVRRYSACGLLFAAPCCYNASQ